MDSKDVDLLRSGKAPLVTQFSYKCLNDAFSNILISSSSSAIAIWDQEKTIKINAQRERERLAKEESERRAIERELSRERYYRDSKGVLVSETEAEANFAKMRLMIQTAEPGPEKEFAKGMLRALEEEWARIKANGPVR